MGGAVTADHFQSTGGGAAGPVPKRGQLVGGAGVPADPDPDAVVVHSGQQGDVSDQAAQQPFAAAVAGGGAVPQPWQVSGQGAQGVLLWRGCGGGLCGGQRGFGVGELGQLGLPAALQAAGDQPVVRVDVCEGAFGAVGFVAGALHCQFGGPVVADAAVGDLVT
jgi:hypothetical protein